MRVSVEFVELPKPVLSSSSYKVDFATAVVTLTPNWFERLLGKRVRRGEVHRARDDRNDLQWWWTSTDRAVSSRVLREIEATSMDIVPQARIVDDTAIDARGWRRQP